MTIAATDTATEPKPSISRLSDWRERLDKALFSSRFEAVVCVLIVFNALILAALCYDYGACNAYIVPVLLALDNAIIAAFFVEIGLKLLVRGRRFFQNGWNVFDLGVIGLCLFGSSYPLTALRSLRILRTLSLIHRIPSMRNLVESFLRAIPGIGSVLMVMLLVLFVYALIGTQLFRAIAPDMFGSLHVSAFTLFTVLTLEGWPDVARGVMDEVPLSWTYFVSYVILNSIAAFNLLIAVVVSAMQKEYDDHAEEEREDILAELKALRAEMAVLIEAQKKSV